ncbi:MAG: hypothetical protein WEE64_11775 [Dehalococcoidia bacterium]
MRELVRRSIFVTLLLGIALGALTFWLPAARPAMSETPSAALAAQPTPTYISELAPAVSIAPRPAAALPATGGVDGIRGVVPTSKIAGLALALAGLALIHAGLRLGPGRAA